MDTNLHMPYGGFSRCSHEWGHGAPVRCDEYRLYFVVGGAGWIQLPGKRHILNRGQIYLIPPQKEHAFGTGNHFDVHWLHFIPHSFLLGQSLLLIRQIQSWPLKSKQHWHGVYTKLDGYFNFKTTAFHCRVQAMVLEFIAEALEKEPAIPPDPSENPTRFRQVLEFMDAHYLENPKLADIARRIKWHPVYFHRQFTQIFHITPHAYMLRKRLRLARELVRSTDMPVKEVATRAGYPNEFYFSRAFSRHFGIAPSQDRLINTDPQP